MIQVACETLYSNQFKSGDVSPRDGFRVVNPRVSHRVVEQTSKSKYALTVKSLAGYRQGYRHLSISGQTLDDKWFKYLTST